MGHFKCRIIAGIPLSLRVLWGSCLEMIAETMNGVICKSHSRDSVLSKDQAKILQMRQEQNFKKTKNKQTHNRTGLVDLMENWKKTN